MQATQPEPFKPCRADPSPTLLKPSSLKLSSYARTEINQSDFLDSKIGVVMSEREW